MAAEHPVELAADIWRNLLTDLRRRGGGRRESGAFLLGTASDAHRDIVDFVCYDDLDPKALERGTIVFRGSGFSALWKICTQRALRVLGDIHTHPWSSVEQSLIDKRFPMIPVKGHLALIAPRFGKTSSETLKPIGIHLYLGSGRWKRYQAEDEDAPIKLIGGSP